MVSLNPRPLYTFFNLVFQDSTAVVLIMDHVLRLLKKQHPEIVSSFFRQDNAGCYHSAEIILSVDFSSKRSGIQINHVDFSDPQGGKSSCDRKAAQIKAHVKRLKQAIESRGGVSCLRVTVMDVQKRAKSYKLDGIRKLNNFNFTSDGFTAFRAYDLGPGKFFPRSSFESGIHC